MEQIGQEDSTEYINAADLLDMTISEDARFDRDRNNVLDSLMGSMVKMATENGFTSYGANLNPKFDSKLLTAISGDLTKLGYEVKTKEVDDKTIGKFILLDVSWASKLEAVDTPTEPVSIPDDKDQVPE